jgi:hypothetical protein
LSSNRIEDQIIIVFLSVIDQDMSILQADEVTASSSI